MMPRPWYPKNWRNALVFQDLRLQENLKNRARLPEGHGVKRVREIGNPVEYKSPAVRVIRQERVPPCRPIRSANNSSRRSNTRQTGSIRVAGMNAIADATKSVFVVQQ